MLTTINNCKTKRLLKMVTFIFHGNYKRNSGLYSTVKHSNLIIVFRKEITSVLLQFQPFFSLRFYQFRVTNFNFHWFFLFICFIFLFSLWRYLKILNSCNFDMVIFRPLLVMSSMGCLYIGFLRDFHRKLAICQKFA